MNKKRIIIICTIVAIIAITIATCVAVYYNIKANAVPDISLIGDESITLELSNTYEEQGAIAILDENDVSQDIIIDGEVDTAKVGEYKIKYITFSKNQKNSTTIERTVVVEDNVKPEITLKGKAEVITYVGNTYKDEGCTATDNYDGDITEKVSLTGEVDTKKEGTYTITYAVEDSSGNKAEATRKIVVKKKTISKGKGLPVLMYHFFYDANAGEKGADNNFMEVKAFEQQMKYLVDNNYYFPSWSEVEAYVDGKITLPEKSIVVTIDDGAASFVKYAIPIIEKYNVKATSFVVTSWNGDTLPKQYASSHLYFESHSHDMHRAGANGKGRIVNLSYNDALTDVKKSQDILGGSTVFCYPFGHYNDTAKKVLKDAGFKLAFTTEGGRVYKGQDKYALPRVRMSKGVSMSSFISAVQ